MNLLSPQEFVLQARQFATKLFRIRESARLTRSLHAVSRVVAIVWAVVQWIPLSPLGAIAVIALYFGTHFKHTDRVLLGIELAGLGLMVVSILAVLATALCLRLRRECPPSGPLRFETDVAFRTGYRLGLAARNPLVRVEIAWQHPLSAQVEMVSERDSIHEVVTARQRGAAAQLTRRFVVSDVFGLARVRFRRRMAVDVTIKPQCGRANARQLLQQQASGEQLSHPDGKPEGDLIEMRRYAAGDALKLVLWKVYARSGQLLVRQPERTIAVTRKTTLYVVSAAGDEAVAGVCRVALEAGVAGSGLLLGTDLDEPPAGELTAAIDQLIRSSAAKPRGGRGLAKTLAAGAQRGCGSCVLFVPPKPGPWLDRVAGTLASYRCQRRAIVGIDRLEASDRQGAWSHWLVEGLHASDWTVAQLHETCRRLTAAGVEVFVVERATGNQHRAVDLRLNQTTNKNLVASGVASCR